MSNAATVVDDLRSVAREDKAAFLPKFFQAFPGGYGQGDRFLGCVVPDQRKIARRYRHLGRDEVRKLLRSPWHEARLTGMLILVAQFEQAHERDEADAEPLVDFYLENLAAANNWDIVDATAHKILGPWLVRHPDRRGVLDGLLGHDSVWFRRVAVIATLAFIREGDFDPTLDFARRLLDDPHELIHKATGWMLREVGKRDAGLLRDFLARHVERMPRTMLRYAIEKLPPAERRRWLAER